MSDEYEPARTNSLCPRCGAEPRSHRHYPSDYGRPVDRFYCTPCDEEWWFEGCANQAAIKGGFSSSVIAIRCNQWEHLNGQHVGKVTLETTEGVFEREVSWPMAPTRAAATAQSSTDAKGN